MDFVEKAAGKYMGGGGGSSGGGGGDVDWSHLGTMAQQFSKAEQHTGSSDLDPSTFKSFLGMGSSGGSEGAKAASGGAPNTDVVHKLLGQFESQTGEQFKGNDSQYEKLEQMAYEASGSKIPLPILKKMVQWKLKGMV